LEAIKVTKLQAAKRQLRTAITLWFQESEPVSIHTLACAAYQIIHDLNAKNKGAPLLYDSDIFKEEFRHEAVDFIKRPFNFFKHAGVKKEQFIEFNPLSTIGYFMFAIQGMRQLGAPRHVIEDAFMRWIGFHRPNWLSDEGRKFISKHFPVEKLELIRSLSKPEFMRTYLQVRGHDV
jgi:hypothetical protein